MRSTLEYYVYNMSTKKIMMSTIKGIASVFISKDGISPAIIFFSRSNILVRTLQFSTDFFAATIFLQAMLDTLLAQ